MKKPKLKVTPLFILGGVLMLLSNIVDEAKQEERIRDAVDEWMDENDFRPPKKLK